MAEATTTRVASVPASHVYVRHLADPSSADGVVRLTDPRPPGGTRVPGGWWPPVMLDPGWIAANHNRFDVFHIQFGFDALGPEQLDEIVDCLRYYGKPLVYTAHDLRNPHHPERTRHDAALDALVPAADAVVTLTDGAAAEIAARWHRDATVVPHPHVVPLDRLDRPRHRRPTDTFVVGLHAKSVRANMDPAPVARVLADVVAELPDARLRLDVHCDVFQPGSHGYDRAVGEQFLRLARHDAVELSVHDFFTDEQLWSYLGGLDASVLPYRFCTHSGWLEACHDLGTAVVAPHCGYLHEQGPCHVFGLDETGFDAESLRHAVRAAYVDRPAPRARAAERHAQRRTVAATHRELYERVRAGLVAERSA